MNDGDKLLCAKQSREMLGACGDLDLIKSQRKPGKSQIKQKRETPKTLIGKTPEL